MTTGRVIWGSATGGRIICGPVPIVKSMVVRVPAGWASAWRMAARSEPAVGAVLLPLSAAVVTSRVESSWRPSRGSTENRRRSDAARRDAAARGLEAGRSWRNQEVDTVLVLWVWADRDRGARATAARVPRRACGSLPKSPC